ncbi:MAG: protein-glutamate O-methyltransferase CheR [Phycisphaerae bacterium]|nr:protein-glutamate O-methyltransferase CheR [Phycisphaerae bacterium]
MEVSSEDIKVISRLVDDLCGIVLDETKGYLIKSRLTRIAEETGCSTFSELYYKVRYANDKTLQTKIIDAITTNETLFFRDTTPFEAMRHKVIPDLIDEKAGTVCPRRLRIWSAACSTGQEPYSMVMVLYELLPDAARWDIQITATDISDTAIRQASLGRYSDMEINRGMTPQMLAKYFNREPSGWKVKDEVRGLVAFRRINLLEPFVGLGPFDIVFCRNVAIYFSPEARRSLFLRLADTLTPSGYLFVGSSESLTDLGPRFAPHQHCRSVFYRPNKSGAAAPQACLAGAGR